MVFVRFLEGTRDKFGGAAAAPRLPLAVCLMAFIVELCSIVCLLTLQEEETLDKAVHLIKEWKQSLNTTLWLQWGRESWVHPVCLFQVLNANVELLSSWLALAASMATSPSSMILCSVNAMQEVPCSRYDNNKTGAIFRQFVLMQWLTRWSRSLLYIGCVTDCLVTSKPRYVRCTQP